MSDLYKNKLKEFYTKQFSKGLRVSKSKHSVTLFLRHDGGRKVVARFNIDFGENIALRLAGLCMEAVVADLVSKEMGVLEAPEDVGSAPEVSGLSASTTVTTREVVPAKPKRNKKQNVVDESGLETFLGIQAGDDPNDAPNPDGDVPV